MRISDWSSDVCSSDLCPSGPPLISLVSEPDPDLLTPIFYNATRYMTQSVIARSERRSLPSPVHTSRRSGALKVESQLLLLNHPAPEPLQRRTGCFTHDSILNAVGTHNPRPQHR